MLQKVFRLLSITDDVNRFPVLGESESQHGQDRKYIIFIVGWLTLCTQSLSRTFSIIILSLIMVIPTHGIMLFGMLVVISNSDRSCLLPRIGV